MQVDWLPYELVFFSFSFIIFFLGVYVIWFENIHLNISNISCSHQYIRYNFVRNYSVSIGSSMESPLIWNGTHCCFFLAHLSLIVSYILYFRFSFTNFIYFFKKRIALFRKYLRCFLTSIIIFFNKMNLMLKIYIVVKYLIKWIFINTRIFISLSNSF